MWELNDMVSFEMHPEMFFILPLFGWVYGGCKCGLADCMDKGSPVRFSIGWTIFSIHIDL